MPLLSNLRRAVLSRGVAETSERRSVNGQPTGPLVNGAEIAVGVAVFFFIGWGLDSWWGTRPALMIGSTLFGTVGFFLRTYYAYTNRMTALEHERSSRSGALR